MTKVKKKNTIIIFLLVLTVTIGMMPTVGAFALGEKVEVITHKLYLDINSNNLYKNLEIQGVESSEYSQLKMKAEGLPEGISLNAETGEISGKPVQEGKGKYRIEYEYQGTTYYSQWCSWYINKPVYGSSNQKVAVYGNGGAKNGNSTYNIAVSKRVIGDEEDKNKEFMFVGKIQSSTVRKTKPTDSWYGVTDIIHDDLKIYTKSMKFVKIKKTSGEIVEEGEIAPNGFGFFHFKMKHDEKTTFSIEKTGNMKMFLYESPVKEYDTVATIAGRKYSGTTTVLTGEVIGVGAIPGGMETRYYSDNPITLKEYGPKLYSITKDTEIDYTNTENTKKYSVFYSFRDTEGNEVPSEVKRFLPQEQRGLPNGAEILPVKPRENLVKVKNGKWKFGGYTFSKGIIDGSNITFTGEWKYIANVKSPGKGATLSITKGREKKSEASKHSSGTYVAEKEEGEEGKEGEKALKPEEKAAVGKSKPVSQKEEPKWMIYVLAGMVIWLVYLSSKIISDLRVLAWYRKKKEKNTVIK